jgi:hypothetical protein
MNELAFRWIDVPDRRIDEIANSLAAHPRMAGHYMLRLIDITELRAQVSEDRMLDAVFEHFDARTWPPFEDRVGFGSWRACEVTAEHARAEIVRAFVGGAEIGHTRETMSAALTGQIWELFSSLFATDRTYFTGLGLGDDKYVFQSGVAIVDATRAGFIGVVEND